MHAKFNHAKRVWIMFSFAVIILISCMSGAAAAQSNGNFQVDTITVGQNSIDEGDPVTITYTIKNVGSTGKKDIILENNEGDVINRTRQRITSGSTFTRTVQWKNTPERPRKKAFPTVRTPDDVDSKEIKILWSEFQVIDFTAKSIEPVNGKNVKLDYTIQNIGSESSSANITIENDKEETIRPKFKTPPIGPEKTYTSTPIKIEQIRGEYTYDLTIENTDTGDTITQSASVTLPNTGAVTIDRSYYDNQDGKIKIDATIENQADFDVKQNVTFLVGGSPVTTCRVLSS